MTKRILLMLTLFALLLTCSCSGGTEATASDASTPDVVSEDENAFIPPEHYATILTVSINPSFDLYLADDDTVIAVKPNNEDAQQMMGHIDYLNRGISDVMDDIVQVAVDDGYLKEGGKVSVDVAFTLKEENAIRQIAQNISERVANRSQDAGIAFEAETTVAEDAFQSEIPAPASSVEATPVSRGNGGNGGNGSNGGSGGNGGKVEGCSVCQGSGKCGYCGAKGRYNCEMCNGNGYLTCHRCGGTGKMKCNCDGGKCHVCHGAGDLACECGGSDPNCPACRGTGRRPCNGCPGNGLCTQCNGTTYSGIDDQCNGTGKEKCGPCNGTGITDCSQCHGNGKCPACKGTGRKS